MNKLVKGALIAVVLEAVSLFIISKIYGRGVSSIAFLEQVLHSKQIVMYAAVATIPNVLLFFYLVNKHQLQVARGIQIIIVLIVLTLGIIKFM